MSLKKKMDGLITALEDQRVHNATLQAEGTWALAKRGHEGAIKEMGEIGQVATSRKDKLPPEAIEAYIDAMALEAGNANGEGDEMTDADVQQLHAAALAMLMEEIQNDPEGKGYKGKTAAEIAALINEPYEVDGVPYVQESRIKGGLELEARTITPKETRPPRIHTIWLGVPHVPNVVDEADITMALEAM